jgi:hypothetical protein
MPFLNRRSLWFALVFLLVFAVGLAFFSRKPSRVTQANYDRIGEGMREAEVVAILGEPDKRLTGTDVEILYWHEGPNSISVLFSVWAQQCEKDLHLASTWETMTWYLGQELEKIGLRKARKSIGWNCPL